MPVYRLYIKPHNIAENNQGIELFVNSESEYSAVQKVMHNEVFPRSFAAINISVLPDAVIVE